MYLARINFLHHADVMQVQFAIRPQRMAHRVVPLIIPACNAFINPCFEADTGTLEAGR